RIAADWHVPLFPIGLGSDREPQNVRVSELTGPARAFPGDSYTVTAYIQSEGFSDQELRVELFSRDVREKVANANGPGTLEGSQSLTLVRGGETVPVKFDLIPGEPGTRTITARVVAPPGDANLADNQREIDVEVVDRKTKVLLIAGGPSREYQFLRNL